MTRTVRPVVVLGFNFSALVAAVLRSVEVVAAVGVSSTASLAHKGGSVVEGVAGVDVRRVPTESWILASVPLGQIKRIPAAVRRS